MKQNKKSKNDTFHQLSPLHPFTSDILLMIAEAENEVNHGPNDLAYECINAVRERAGIKKLAAIWMKRASAKLSKTNVQWNSASSTHVVSTDPLGRLLQTDAGTSGQGTG